eukprot:TRINITY_DN7559_c0_g1_i2.p1 TRINITY_DN7559_c0_g1~~TRINITY_DN7559_c0_g1_i2.p1  ORF type:complete len:124 (-),score=19.52 TRINITY_DN7559_c0_g1_i2:95-466(-)
MTDSLARSGTTVRDTACSGAPAYTLCCYSCCMLPLQTPSRAIVLGMGGNDFMWLPVPFLHCCLTKLGCGCPLLYTRLMLKQASYWAPGRPVIFIPDRAITNNCAWVGYEQLSLIHISEPTRPY